MDVEIGLHCFWTLRRVAHNGKINLFECPTLSSPKPYGDLYPSPFPAEDLFLNFGIQPAFSL